MQESYYVYRVPERLTSGEDINQAFCGSRHQNSPFKSGLEDDPHVVPMAQKCLEGGVVARETTSTGIIKTEVGRHCSSPALSYFVALERIS